MNSGGHQHAKADEYSFSQNQITLVQIHEICPKVIITHITQNSTLETQKERLLNLKNGITSPINLADHRERL